MTQIQNLTTTFTHTNTTVIIIQGFIVNSVFSEPFLKGMIYISLIDTNGILYQRKVELLGEDYINWTTDEYLISYISDRIESIYHSTI